MKLAQRQREAIFEDMLASRVFDEACQRRIEAGDSFPHFHAGIGQEALSVASVRALEPDDTLLYTHRGYGHLLARGLSFETILADMLYRTTGTNRGFGGVLHVNDPERQIPGRNGVFGTRFTIAAGHGIARRLRAENSAVLCFYGEAAGTRGPLFEALNVMSLWDLPVVLVAENNGYSVSSRTEELYAPGDMSTFAEGFDVDREVVDGNDADAVFEAATEALAQARRGNGPTVIEGETYRIPPHTPSDDDGRYRSREEVEEARRKDPVRQYAERLEAENVLTTDDVAALRSTLETDVEAAIAAAKAAPEPEPRDAMAFVYYEEGEDR